MKHELAHVNQWSHKSTKPKDEGEYHAKTFNRLHARTNPAQAAKARQRHIGMPKPMPRRKGMRA